jgi:hypothetical protein
MTLNMFVPHLDNGSIEPNTYRNLVMLVVSKEGAVTIEKIDSWRVETPSDGIRRKCPVSSGYDGISASYVLETTTGLVNRCWMLDELFEKDKYHFPNPKAARDMIPYLWARSQKEIIEKFKKKVDVEVIS